MMDGRIRVGFVGVGSMGQCAHLRNYAALPDCDVTAIAELRGKTAKRVAERYGVATVYEDASGMLANEELDALVASQPFRRHGVVLPELIEYGKPIFIEKPLSSTIDSGEGILRALNRSRAWIMVGYHKRSDPASMYAREHVQALRESGELGQLRYVRVVMPAGDWIAGGFADLINEGDPAPALEMEPGPSDMDEETYGAYQSFVNYYIHQVNLVRYFLDEPYRVTYADPAGVLLAGLSEGGTTCLIEMSPYTTTVDWQESVLIAFEHGYVKLELPAPLASNRPGTVEVFKDPGGGATPTSLRPQLPWIHAMRQQATNFVAAVKGEREPMCDASEALEDLRVAREYIRLLRG